MHGYSSQTTQPFCLVLTIPNAGAFVGNTMELITARKHVSCNLFGKMFNFFLFYYYVYDVSDDERLLKAYDIFVRVKK